LEKIITAINEDINLEEERRSIELSKIDPSHFRPLYEKYFKTIFRFVFQKTGDKETTADIVSQVFVKALTNLHGYKYMGFPFSAWLCRIATNEVMQHFRQSAKHRCVSIDEQMLEHICEDAQGPDIEELKYNIEKIIHELDYGEVQILELRYFENKSYKEIAFILQSTETNVKTKAWRIIEKIRKKLSKTHDS
jgi:RNA polymerase sigma-70 factor (ECF subfamily)